MKKSLHVFFLFWLILVTLPAMAGNPIVLNGQWRGPLKVPGGTLELIVTIVPLTNGSFYAALI